MLRVFEQQISFLQMELVLYVCKFERDMHWKKLIGEDYGDKKKEKGWCSYEVRDTYGSACKEYKKGM